MSAGKSIMFEIIIYQGSPESDYLPLKWLVNSMQLVNVEQLTTNQSLVDLFWPRIVQGFGTNKETQIDMHRPWG